MNFQLKALLQERKMTCLQLEKILQIPNAKLSEYTRNVSFPKTERAIIIGDYFNCSLDYLTGLSSIRKENELSQPSLSVFQKRLNELIATNKSKTKFFKKCQLSRTNFHRWQNSKEFPKLQNLFLIAYHNKTSLDYLLGRTSIKEIIAWNY